MNIPVHIVWVLRWDNSLFSTIITLYTLLLLYSPCILLPFLFSPVVMATLILLLYLLRLGADESSYPQDKMGFSSSSEDIAAAVAECTADSSRGPELRFACGSDRNPFNADSFVEWDVRAPLEVIYEEHGEGEEVEPEVDVILRYASLSLFYPESDDEGDSSSSEGIFLADGLWRSPEYLCSRWEDETEDGEDNEAGLIEIALDGKRINDDADEENLIEIDLSPWTDVDYRRAAT